VHRLAPLRSVRLALRPRRGTGVPKVTESFNYDKPWAFTVTLSHKEKSNLRDMAPPSKRIESIVTA